MLLHCAGQEGLYNPYYSHVLQKLCALDRKYRFSAQMAFWDFFKLLQPDEHDAAAKAAAAAKHDDDEGEDGKKASSDEASPRKCANLASMLAHLIAEESLPLGVIKVLAVLLLSSRHWH